MDRTRDCLFFFVFTQKDLPYRKMLSPTQRAFWVLQILQKIQGMQEREVLYYLEQ